MGCDTTSTCGWEGYVSGITSKLGAAIASNPNASAQMVIKLILLIVTGSLLANGIEVEFVP